MYQEAASGGRTPNTALKDGGVMRSSSAVRRAARFQLIDALVVSRFALPDATVCACDRLGLDLQRLQDAAAAYLDATEPRPRGRLAGRQRPEHEQAQPK